MNSNPMEENTSQKSCESLSSNLERPSFEGKEHLLADFEKLSADMEEARTIVDRTIPLTDDQLDSRLAAVNDVSGESESDSDDISSLSGNN